MVSVTSYVVVVVSVMDEVVDVSATVVVVVSATTVVVVSGGVVDVVVNVTGTVVSDESPADEHAETTRVNPASTKSNFLM